MNITQQQKIRLKSNFNNVKKYQRCDHVSFRYGGEARVGEKQGSGGSRGMANIAMTRR